MAIQLFAPVLVNTAIRDNLYTSKAALINLQMIAINITKTGSASSLKKCKKLLRWLKLPKQKFMSANVR